MVKPTTKPTKAGVRVLLTADCHLRDRQYNRPDRGEDFRRSFTQIIDIAIQEKVCAGLIAGDLFDVNRPSSENVKFLFAVDRRLREAGIPFYVSPGDHDKTDPPWPEIVQDQAGEDVAGLKMLCNQLVTIPKTNLTLFGMDFIGKTKDVFLTIKDTLPAADILLWHTMVREFGDFLGEAAVSLEELPLDRYKLIALGDIHSRKYIQHEASGCWVGYPGSTELCKSDEPLEKSVEIFEFEDHRVTGHRRVPLKTRQAFVYRLYREEDVAAALLEVSAAKSQNPMVFARYNPNLPNVVGRFYEVLDPDKAIIRLASLEEVEKQVSATGEEEPDRTVESFLPEFLRPGSKIYTLAEHCCDPQAPVSELLDKYIDSAA